MQTIDPLNYCVVKIQSYFNEEKVAKATGFFYSGTVDSKHTLWLVTNWHVLAGRNASKPEIVLHSHGAIPNRIQLQVPSRIGGDGEVHDRELVFYEIFVELFDSNGLAMWHQHPSKHEVDIGVVNLGQALDGHLVRGINEVCSEHDMAVEIGNEVFILGYPLGFSHFANTPIWKRGSIASEPHAETAESRNRIVIDATTRKGMSGSPVVMRSKTHYVTESGQIVQKANGSRFIGVYASRPAPEREPTNDEIEAGFLGHEIGYVFKSGCLVEVITRAVRGPQFGEPS